MNPYSYKNGELFVEGASLAGIAQQFGTPAFVYSRASIENAYLEFANVNIEQPLTICYAMKANGNLGVLDCLNRLGAGFDIVSAGELQRVLAAGGKAEQVVFSGVGKTADEMRVALKAGVRCFNVESVPELHQLSQVADEMQTTAPVSIRVNPNVDAGTHPYISTGLRENKFGIAHEDVPSIYQLAQSLPGLDVVGIDCHIGSQITELAPYLDALDRLIDLIGELEQNGISLKHIDLGGGLGVEYESTDVPPSRAELIEAISRRMKERLQSNANQYELIFEFGRSIVADAGVLLTQVIYLKPTAQKNFAIVDAAMNDLLRPTLYQASHQVMPVRKEPTTQAQAGPWDLVGPICESGDWLAKNIDASLEPADLLAIRHAGAYGMVMSSNYNTRARAVELMVSGSSVQVVRERESIEQLFASEHRLRD